MESSETGKEGEIERGVHFLDCGLMIEVFSLCLMNTTSPAPTVRLSS